MRFNNLVDAIRWAAESTHAAPPTSATRPPATDLAGLTAREYEVLQMLRLGMQHEEIARQLAITERTARKHAASIKEKLGASNVADAVSKGFERGLLSVIPHRIL